MQYFGAKSRIANDIVQILEDVRLLNQLFVEPFTGAANIVSKMSGERHAYDLHEELIQMWISLQDGWIPPKTLSKEEYDHVRYHGSPQMKAFAGFGCSFGGKYFGGYAKNSRGDNFAQNTHNSLLKKTSTLGGVRFEQKDYRELSYCHSLIYCDPPYRNTTKYKVGDFDSDIFWEWCRKMNDRGNTMIISEYQAPEDFDCIWSIDTKTEMRTKENGREMRTEKLFSLI